MKNIDKVRDSILESAAYFFDRFGYEKTSVDDIAHRVHKAKSSGYSYPLPYIMSGILFLRGGKKALAP